MADLFTDLPVYAWAAAAGVSLFLAVYSIRKFLELKNAPSAGAFALEEDAPAADLPRADLPEPVSESVSESEPGVYEASPEPSPETGPLPAEAGVSEGPAVTFVKGIYDGVSGLDARLKGIEASISRHGPGDDFTIKFLEDMVADFDSLDKGKLKARIEFLLADLKK